MLIIGLTGGIGSGKTLASDYLAEQGITVVDADQVAREVVQPGEPALDAIAARFGPEMLLADGSLNRPALRQRVFADPAERAALESITHPAIRARILKHLQDSTSAYTLLVSPLLFETGQAGFCQRTLVIDAEECDQKARAASRDGVSEAQIASIMAAQLPRDERLRRADDIIINLGAPADLYLQLDDMHRKYLDMAAELNYA
jgi:dephospho-CoA kinase